MRRVDVKLGFACNNHCKFCVQGNKRNFLTDRTTEAVKTILRDCRLEGIEGVVFTGGEPTIRKDIIELVRYAKKLGFKVIQIQSNGRMFCYLDFCKEIINAGATEFSPALHGHNSKVHDFLTGANGSFEQTVKGIENLKQLNQRVLTNTVVTSHNYKYLPDIARLLVKLDVNQFQFAFVHIVGVAMLNSDWIVPRKKDIMEYVKKGLDIGIKAGKGVMTEAIPFCFMQGYEEYVAEKIIPSTKVFDFDMTVEDFNEARVRDGKSKGPGCKICKYDKACEGPWKEYIDLFGSKELCPKGD